MYIGRTTYSTEKQRKARKCLEWLNRFVAIWERDLVTGEKRHNMLCNLYCAYCDLNDLPAQSAEDTMFTLRGDC